MIQKLWNNPWNRLIHWKKVSANIALKTSCMVFLERSSNYAEKLGTVTYDHGKPATITGFSTLLEVFNLQKKIWKDCYKTGMCPKDLKSFPSNIFEIRELEIYNVNLGGCYGLPTNNIGYWEKNKDTIKPEGNFPIFQDLSVYELLLMQYKERLSKDIERIQKNVKKLLAQLEILGY